MAKESIHVASRQEAVNAANRLIDLYVEGGEKPCSFTFEADKKGYSSKQRGALHVWCSMLADTLNESGRYRVILSPINRREIESPWCMDTVKQDVYKPVLKALTGKTSTEHQTSVNPSDVAQVISKHFGDDGLICPPWPSLR